MGPQLVSLIPFEESEEEIIRPTSTGAARVLSQTISIEGSVPKPQKVIAGKEPRPPGPKSASPKSAGPKPTGSKLIARKEPKFAGPMPASAKPVGGRPPRPIVGGKAPRPTVGGKVPRKQVVPPKKKSRPGSGSLNYVPGVVADLWPNNSIIMRHFFKNNSRIMQTYNYLFVSIISFVNMNNMKITPNATMCSSIISLFLLITLFTVQL